MKKYILFFFLVDLITYWMKKKKLPTTNGTTQIPFLLRLISQIQIDITTYI